MKIPSVYLALCCLATVSACGPAGPERDIPVYRYGNTAGGGSLGMHTVQTGETLWAISQKYNLDLRDVLDRNHLAPPYDLPAGTRLSLPAPSLYRVQGGDTLYKVSRVFDASLTDLVRLNGLKAPYKLSAGQNLRLPVRRQTVPPPLPAPKQVFTAAQAPATSIIQKEELPPASFSAPKKMLDSSPRSAEKPTGLASQKVVAPIVEPPARTGRFLRPVGGKIVSSFGPKQDGLHNDGINIRAAKGDGVRAAEHGVVVYADDQMEGYGNLILLRHADGYVTAYAHLDKTLVKKGEKVGRGQMIGTVGTSGRVASPQLHFEIRKGTKALDPQLMIKS